MSTITKGPHFKSNKNDLLIQSNCKISLLFFSVSQVLFFSLCCQLLILGHKGWRWEVSDVFFKYELNISYYCTVVGVVDVVDVVVVNEVFLALNWLTQGGLSLCSTLSQMSQS